MCAYLMACEFLQLFIVCCRLSFLLIAFVVMCWSVLLVILVFGFFVDRLVELVGCTRVVPFVFVCVLVGCWLSLLFVVVVRCHVCADG